jgi:hypothetical protein
MAHITGTNQLSKAFIPLTQVLSPKENEFLEELQQIPLDLLVSHDVEKMQCYNIGQRIFNHFKEESGSSEAAQKAMHNIKEALPYSCIDGWERKQFVVAAWRGVGDDNWYWW